MPHQYLIRIFSLLFLCAMVVAPQSLAQPPGIQPLPPAGERVGPGLALPDGSQLSPPPSTVPPSVPSQATQTANSPWAFEEVFAPTWYHPSYWFGPDPWETSIEVGINGYDGTTESMSMRVGGHLQRKTDWNKVDLQLLYNQTSSEGTQTQNNAVFDGRHDWLLGESPWTLFVATSLLYDEFQAFDLRFAANGGVGYQLIETERTNLIGRFGAGTSREFGGPDDRWVPEALLGAEYDFAISDCQKLYAKVDYFPDWADFASYRVVSDAGWELVVDAETNLSLKLSVNDRYDSTPNGAEPNLLNYAVLLLWKL